MKKLLCLLLLTSCSTFVSEGEPIPAWDMKATQVCMAEVCPEPKQTAAALVLIEQSMISHFGQSHEVLRRVTVVYHEADECGRGCTGEGDLTDPSKVHVYEGDDTVAGSALTHEVLHVLAIKIFGGDGDSMHQIVGLWKDPELNISSVEGDVQKELLDAGI
jgi:hypothetical protein